MHTDGRNTYLLSWVFILLGLKESLLKLWSKVVEYLLCYQKSFLAYCLEYSFPSPQCRYKKLILVYHRNIYVCRSCLEKVLI